MLVIRIEFTNVFHKLFDRNGFHVIWGNKMVFKVTRNASVQYMTLTQWNTLKTIPELDHLK